MQGDICKNLPRITPDKVSIDMKTGLIAWEEYLTYLLEPKTASPVKFSVNPIPTIGVLLTQTCDVRKGKNLLFAELTTDYSQLDEIRRMSNVLKIAKKKINIIRQETRFHFFPADKSIPVLEKLNLLNFENIFQVPYDIINSNISVFFVARLKSPARKVLCDKISRFFTRLAFEEIIFLTDEEIKARISRNKITQEEAEEVLKLVDRSLEIS